MIEFLAAMNSEYNSDSDSSAAPSPSPPASPTTSIHTLPSVERLLQYFVSAKRSLSSTNYVWRANELVTSSRSFLEETAILNARNTFGERAVNEQLDTLYNVRDEIATAGTDAGDEFQGTIKKLDLANDRLERTLNALRKTIVDASLGSNGKEERTVVNGLEDAESSKSDVEEEKTLYDFIDEANHTELQASLRGLIDSFNDSRADLDSSVHHFEDSLRTVTETLSNNSKTAEPPHIGTIYDEPPPTISHIFRGMEDHAAEMAKLLESLVGHYDLCVTALKHTEGGGEAAKRAIQQAEESLTKGPRGRVEESLYLKTAPEPISTEERTEMLRVLENDAQEVDDVVTEIKDRNRDQEGQYEQLTRKANDARSKNQRVRQVLQMLHEIKDIHLPSHLHALATFRSSWKRIQALIESQTAELAGLSGFYDSFLSGYAKLLREVDRRRAADVQMRKVADKARRDLEKLYEADRGLRADFMEETGKYLPQGIWSGLMEGGVRWEVKETGLL